MGRITKIYQLSELKPIIQQELQKYLDPAEQILYCSVTTQYPGLLTIFNWVEILDTGRLQVQIITNQQVICLNSHLNKVSTINCLRLDDVFQVLYTKALGEHFITIKGAGESRLGCNFENSNLAKEFQQMVYKAKETQEQKSGLSSPGKSPLERLRALEELHIAGLITDEEYFKKRNDILNGI